MLNLPVVYRIVFSCNRLELLEDHHVYYEYISYANKHICYIVAFFHFVTILLILYMIHLLMDIWMNTRPYIEFVYLFLIMDPNWRERGQNII